MYSANCDSTISRRHAIKIMGLGAATSMAMATSYAFSSKPANSQTAQPNLNQPSKIITKEIPLTQERIPAIGLGTFLTFDVLSNQPRNNLQQVMQC